MLQQLLERRDLSQRQAEGLLAHLTDPQLPPAMAGALLAALSAKGLVAEEVRGLAQAMRRLARRPELPPDLRAIDIVGTGGDASGSFNISTGTALLTAACGVPVVKHGNRSVSSRCGSADVLEALGLTVPLDEAAAGACLAATRFTFLFAPHYHPATASVAPVRAALGVRTMFNILGPLVNPAEPPFHLVGAFSLEVAQLLADAFEGLPIERTFVVHGADGWDEPTPIGPFTLFDVRPGAVASQRAVGGRLRAAAMHGRGPGGRRCALQRARAEGRAPGRGPRRSPRLSAARHRARARGRRRGARAARGRGTGGRRHRERRRAAAARGSAAAAYRRHLGWRTVFPAEPST